MAGAFTAGGLITGINTNQIIAQLVEIERQPILRVQAQIRQLEAQQTALRDLRTQLITLRNRAQDFQFSTIFDQFAASVSDEDVLTAEVTGSNPAVGAYSVNVTQLATATVATSSAVLGASINPNVPLDSSGISTQVTAGTFTINGVSFTIDPSTDSLTSILSQITASAAGVNATYNASTDKVEFTNQTPGDSRLINFGATGDTSNFLQAITVVGATQVDGGGGTTQVASTRHLGAVDPSDTLQTINFANGAVTSGTFRINGIAITVDPTTDTLQDVLERINNSDAGVTASYDATNDTIRVVSETLGTRTIGFGSGSDTSNFLSITNLTTATQTAGEDAQFTIDGGPTLTRNTNEVADAISGVTLRFLSTGTTTVTVASDNEAVIEGVQGFLDALNTSLGDIGTLIGPGGALEADTSLRIIEDFLRTKIFDTVSGITGDFSTLADVGITTGDAFDPEVLSQYTLDEDAFLEALRTDRDNLEALFSNSGDTGIGDQLFDYLDEVTSLTGFLNERARTGGMIDQRIEAYNDRIDRLEMRVTSFEQRLRAQFARMEQLASGFQQQGSALSGLASNLSLLNFWQR